MSRLTMGLVCAVLFSAINLSAAPGDTQEEKQIIEAADHIGQAFVSRDTDALKKLFHDDLTWGHSTGGTETKEELLKDVAGPAVWEVFKFSKQSIHIYGSVAVVRCIADIRNGEPPRNPVHDGKFTVLLVLVKGAQGWQLVGEQRAHVPEPAPAH